MNEKIDTVDIHGKKHPTYASVLHKAHENGLKEISTELVQSPLKDNNYMAIVHARVVTEKGVFEGMGDATPKNVNKMIAPHIVRMAETRAKGRALRDALDIADALAEEMGGDEWGDFESKQLVGEDGKGNEADICAYHKVEMFQSGRMKSPGHKHEKYGWCNGEGYKHEKDDWKSKQKPRTKPKTEEVEDISGDIPF